MARLQLQIALGEQLKLVMVGDSADANFSASDPTIPVIVVSEAVRKGNWALVNGPIQKLFSGTEQPHEVYDALFAAAAGSGSRQVPIEGNNYEFVRVDGGRVIRCS